MLFEIRYEVKAAAGTKAHTAALMEEFGERGEVAGTVAHYVYPGGGGMVIAEQNDPAVLYESVSAYSEWLDFEVRPILPVDDAVPIILEYLGS